MGRQVVSCGCHLAERKKRRLCGSSTTGACQGASSSGPRSKRRLFIASASSFSRVYDHSLPHSRLATGDPSRSSPYLRLLPNYASDPLAGLVGR
ncbi:unnamed protein product [Spirodela intermedia]|uniref:Uncharacterized protein n=1 Tax=Spirodela intermedia TaxID=51605 RepID=A0ABN7EBX7_SPIIN|nr:unnamed protein product [Spirodela intermedia]